MTRGADQGKRLQSARGTIYDYFHASRGVARYRSATLSCRDTNKRRGAVPPLITRRRSTRRAALSLPNCQASVPASQTCPGASRGVLRRCQTVPASVPASRHILDKPEMPVHHQVQEVLEDGAGTGSKIRKI